MRKLILCLALLSFANAEVIEVAKPSFDCTKAKSEVEKMICADEKLQRLDREITKTYSNLITKLNAQDKKALLYNQRLWIKEFQKCRSKECVENTLLQRKGYLKTIDEGDLSFTSNYWEGTFTLKSPSGNTEYDYNGFIKIQSCNFNSCKLTYESRQAMN